MTVPVEFAGVSGISSVSGISGNGAGWPKPLTLGEVALRSNDGEGKDADKKQKTQRYKPCLSETSYRCAFVFYFAWLALSGAGAPALLAGEPLAKRFRFR